MIQFKNLNFGYTAGQTVVGSLSGEIPAGLTLLLGPNGCGKTSLLKLMAGVLAPTSGSCLLDGVPTFLRLPATLERLFFFDDSFTVPFRSVRQLSEAMSDFYAATFSPEDFETNLAAYGLTGNEKFRNQSLGQRKQSLTAYILALGAEVLLMDEPANGLDIEASKIFFSRLAHCIRPEQTVVISTHVVAGAGILCDRLAVMGNHTLMLNVPVEKITGALAFVHSPSPVKGALYQELNAGLWHAVVRAEQADQSSVDFGLLYCALMSPAGEDISLLINQ